MITVRVLEVGGVNRDQVQVNDGSTVESALRAAGANVQNEKTIMLNGREAELSDLVSNGDSLYVVPQIKGNL